MKISRLSALLLVGVLILTHIFLDQQFHPTVPAAEEAVLPEPEIQIPAISSPPKAPALHAHYA